VDLTTSGYVGSQFDLNWGARATYIFKGWFDVGAGVRDETYDDHLQILFANVVLLHPKNTRGIGLEIKGRYSNKNRYSDWYHFPVAKIRERTYTTGLRGFYRNASASLVVGLGAIYIFNQDQSLDQAGEVLWGHDYGEVGFTLDGHFLVGRFVPLSLQVEFAEDNQYSFSEDWLFTVVLSTGFTFGRNSAPGGETREP